MDTTGRVIFSTTQEARLGDDVSANPVIQAALSGKTVAATEIVSADFLANENEILKDKACIPLISTPKAQPRDKKEETSGMVLMAAAPIIGPDERLMGVLYGGILLNRNFEIVDHVWELIYSGEQYRNKNIGTVTIFLGDLRVSTNVTTNEGTRAIGTRVSSEVYEAVLTRGEVWSDRAFVVNDWYLSEYEPILNYHRERIGILYVGLLEKAYLSIRNRIILTLMGIATFGFGLIILISYLITGTITRPLGRMVAVTRLIAAGDLDQRVRIDSHDEIGKLALAFNTMVRSLKRTQTELEEWGRTLEQKVRERTEELEAMQTKVIQTEKMASLGKMAAGIAHEINNPLGGILALSSLQLEDMDRQDPDRENIEEVVKQAIRCRDIVKGLLEFSRQTETRTGRVKINDVLDTTFSLIEKQSIFYNIEVVKHYHPELPLVMVDTSQFQQVFMNIILNAIEAMRETGTLTIETDYDELDNMVIINTTDTGSGIPDAITDKIFDPFFTTKDVGKGTGLGLSIVYGIITRHDGRISVHSEVDKGTTFSIRIPASEQAPKPREEKAKLS